jgi:hypothetical protein
MACVNQTRPHCVNQMGRTQSTALAERHGNGTAGEQHGMCESAFNVSLWLVRGIYWNVGSGRLCNSCFDVYLNVASVSYRN